MRWTAFSLCLLLTAGCSDGEEARAPMHKRMAPVDITYQVPPDATVGTPVDVVVGFTMGSAVSRADLSFHAGRGLRIDSPDTSFQYGPMEAGDSRSETITVTPEVDGTVSLHAYVGGVAGERRMTRATSIPVGSGPPVQPPLPGTLKTDPVTGRKIIEMPVQGK